MGQTSNTISIRDRSVEFTGTTGFIAPAAEADAQARFYPTGHSARMEHVRRTIAEVSGSLAPVLITGEAGSGKEWAARYIHAVSPRADQPFVAVDCASVPPGQMAAEIFGQEKSFEGIVPAGAARIEAAQNVRILQEDALAECSDALFEEALSRIVCTDDQGSATLRRGFDCSAS